MKSELQPEEMALSHKLQTQSSLIYTESKCPHGGKNTKELKDFYPIYIELTRKLYIQYLYFTH